MGQTDEIETTATLATLLVGLDGSPTSANALDWAVGTVGDKGRVVALHAVSAASDIMSAIVSLDPDALANEARHMLEGEWTEAARRAGGLLTTRLAFDHTAAALIAAAEEVDAGAVVVGAHGQGRWSRNYLGSTASKLLHRCRRPVIVVPGEAEATEPSANRVVVGYDGSAAAEAAITWAEGVAAERDLPLDVVTVVAPAEYATAELYAAFDLERYREDTATRIHETVVRLLPEPRTEVLETLVFGEPLPTLLDATDTAWLLVVARPLSGRLDEYLAGSTARICAARGHCPVAVIPER